MIEPLQLAGRAWSVSGILPGRLLHRLALQNEAASVSLRFWTDESAGTFAAGRVDACVLGRCERCLAALEMDIAASFQWVFVAPGELSPVGGDWDEIELPGPTVDLVELLEDELLLSVPPYPKHGAACGGGALAASTVEEAPARRPSPFAVLGRLRVQSAEAGPSDPGTTDPGRGGLD